MSAQKPVALLRCAGLSVTEIALAQAEFTRRGGKVVFEEEG